MTNQAKKPKEIINSTQQLENTFVTWQTCLQLWDNEANRFWIRSNIFLIINGVLITFLSSKTISNTFLMVSSAAGLILCVIWFKVNVKGRWYIKRWRPIIIEIEKQLNIEVFQKLREQKDPSKLKASTNYMKDGIILFIAYYAFLLIQGGYGLTEDYFSKDEILNIPLKVENSRLTDEGQNTIIASLEGYDYQKIRVDIRISIAQQQKNPTIQDNITDQLLKIGFNKKNLNYNYFSDDTPHGKKLNKYEVVWLSFSH